LWSQKKKEIKEFNLFEHQQPNMSSMRKTIHNTRGDFNTPDISYVPRKPAN
jgi:hypothetical protein